MPPIEKGDWVTQVDSSSSSWAWSNPGSASWSWNGVCRGSGEYIYGERYIKRDRKNTYVVGGLFIFISLLVCCGLGLIWTTLLIVQGLPSLTEHLSDLAWRDCQTWEVDLRERKGKEITESDARVFLADIVTLFVGEEHVGGETTLGGIGVCHGR